MVLLYTASSKINAFICCLITPQGTGIYLKAMLRRESEKDTVLRELAEETQITDAVFDEGFREELSYSFSRGDELVDKTVVFYLLETKTEDVVLSLEHRDFLWLDYINARDKLTYDNTKKILDKAKKHLTP